MSPAVKVGQTWQFAKHILLVAKIERFIGWAFAVAEDGQLTMALEPNEAEVPLHPGWTLVKDVEEAK